ncbi:protein tyrosine kinase [Aphanothece sacrum FPU3]|nr:protein tyrosine kinase [Aphanothece sacrum FPU3]
MPEEQLEDLKTSSQGGLNFRPYLRIFLRKAWLIAGLTTLTTFAGGIISSLDPYTYTGNFYLLVEPITSSAKLTNPSTLARTDGQPDESLFELDYPTNQVFLQSPGMTLKIAQEVHQKVLTREVPAIWKDLRENLKVTRASLPGPASRSGVTKIFEVSYTGKSPQEVQQILSTAAATFLKYSSEDRETNIKAGVKFIDSQLPDLQERLKNLRTQQKQIRQQNELVDPLPKNNEVLTQITQLQNQQFDIETQLKGKKHLSNILQEQLKLTPNEALASATLSQDPSRVSLLSQLQELDSQIAIASATYTIESPQIQDLKDKRENIVNLLNQKTQEILGKNSLFIASDSAALGFQDPTRLNLIGQLLQTNNEIQVLETQLPAIKEARQTIEKEAQRYPVLINQYSDIQTQINLAEEILNKLLVQRETLKVESAQDLPWQLISKPQIPLDENGKPIGFPPDRKKKVLAGVMGGLLLGMGLAILWEKRQNIFHAAEDIAETLSLPILGDIPKDGRTGFSSDITVKPKPAQEISNLPPNYLQENVNYEKPNHLEESYFLEAFEKLYTQLYLVASSKISSLIISSVEPKDGQSKIALYLAISAANSGKKVLLVDTNWTRPKLHELLDVPNQKGLIQLLRDRVPSNEIIQDVPNIDNLFILTAGNPEENCTKRLWSPQMENLMEEFSRNYDLVIYDTPNFFETSDIKFMTKKTDGILMVIALKKTPQSLAKKAVKEIKDINLPCLGVVANHLQ